MSDAALPGFTHPEYRVTDPLDTDYYAVFKNVPAADRDAWLTAREVAEGIREQLADSWDRHEYRKEWIPMLGAAGLLRDGVKHPHLEPMSPLAAGLVNMELSRVDGSLGTMLAVQGGLGLRSLVALGSDAQKNKYVRAVAAGEVLIAGGITEPDHGSDSVAMETEARRHADGSWTINGVKKWIGNGAAGGLTVVFARVNSAGSEDHGKVRAWLIPQDTPGYVAEVIKPKGALRGLDQAVITLRNVTVGEDTLMTNCRSFHDLSRVLWATRAAVAWSALGHATGCFEAALTYARQRVQFGKPLIEHQLIQQRLTTMLTDLVSMQLFSIRTAQLDAEGELEGAQAAMAKFHNTSTARRIAANARDMLGGNGILLEHGVIQHMADIEAIHTYEGTESVQSLLIGRDITGADAFS